MSNYVTGTIQKYIEEKKLMEPLWIAYPLYCQYSMAWRMGVGEEYADKFREWFSKFSDEDKEVYRKLFPTPIGWYGWWYDEVEEDPTFYSKGDLFTGYWEPTGSNTYTADWLNHKLQEKDSVNVVTCTNDATSRVLPSGWAQRRFEAPADDPETIFYSVMEYVLKCKSLYFGDGSLDKLISSVYKDPDSWGELKHEIQLYTDQEWERILPGLLATGFYYQITQNKELLNIVLRSCDSNVYLITDAKDGLLCGYIAEDEPKIIGKNLLGFALMNARDEIYKIYANVELCVNFDDLF